jgi:hypothetical protein
MPNRKDDKNNNIVENKTILNVFLFVYIVTKLFKHHKRATVVRMKNAFWAIPCETHQQIAK